MKVVGLDFGTTNVRVSFWDSERDAWGQDEDGAGPQPQMIGEGGTATMPAVVALQRLPGGEVTVLVGEEADQAEEDAQTLVIRNIKRHALSSDPYVNWHLEGKAAQGESSSWPPAWWDSNKLCVRAWDQEFPVWDLIENILDEALGRAGMEGDFEWRAGCPVHSGYHYRSGLTRALRALTGKGQVNWVVEEPVLFLTLAHRQGVVGESGLRGSHMVYDLGGGSFDCAIVQAMEDGQQMVVYGADGHPLLGGADIDEMITDKLELDAGRSLVRLAKEALGSTVHSRPVGEGKALTNDVLEATLGELGFINKSLTTMHDAYIAAKVLWKRGTGDDDPPIGEVINLDTRTGVARHVWQLTWNEMATDLDSVILFGGPTRSEFFSRQLSRWFGSEKVMSTSEALPELSQSIQDLELVGVSMGACYAYEGAFSPLYLNRLPAQVTLEDMETGAKVEYEPFQTFTPRFHPFGPFRSGPLTRPQPIVGSPEYPRTYQLTVNNGDGLVFKQEFVDEYINPRLMNQELRLIIDRYGRIGVEQRSQMASPKRYLIFEDTPWQTEMQREALQQLLEQDRRRKEREDARGRGMFGGFPWEYPTP